MIGSFDHCRKIETTDPRIIMKFLFYKFANNESGATAIEYGIIAGVLSLAIVSAASSLGGGMDARFQQVSDFIAQ